MITDRQRVEALLLPMLMLDVLINGVLDQKHPDFQRASKLLQTAVNEALKGLMGTHRAKLMRRTKRTHEALLSAYRDAEARIDKVGLMVFYVLQDVLECDYLVLAPGSAMSEAMDLVIPALMPAAEIEKLNASAKKAARKTLALLQTMGYFDGVGMPEAA